jgi:hypothetical protein
VNENFIAAVERRDETEAFVIVPRYDFSFGAHFATLTDWIGKIERDV